MAIAVTTPQTALPPSPCMLAKGAVLTAPLAAPGQPTQTGYGRERPRGLFPPKPHTELSHFLQGGS